ncbi:malic enzyme-like NAD(P)-binding protein [Candidatus Dependentiae bacterium]
MKKFFVIGLLFLMFINQNLFAELVEQQTLRLPITVIGEEVEQEIRDYTNNIYITNFRLDSVYKGKEQVNKKLSKLLEHWVKIMGLDPASIILDFHPKPQDREKVEKDILALKEGEFYCPKARGIVKRILILEIYKKLLDIYAGKEGQKGIDSIATLTSQLMGLVYSPGVGYVSAWLSDSLEKAFDKFVRTNRYAYNFKGGNRLEEPRKRFGKQRNGVNMYTVTDGSATLGIGNVGLASLPVMFGKSILLEAFGGKSVKSDICYVDTQKYWNDVKTSKTKSDREKAYNKIIRTVVNACKAIKELHPKTVIMLEDIAAPVCFEIEKQLNEEGIFTIHDDQWGTAITFSAGIINAIKLVGKKPQDLKVVISGAGASAVAVARTLHSLGVGTLIAYDSRGAIHRGRSNLSPEKRELAAMNNDDFDGKIEEALIEADGFIGLSIPGLFKGREIEMLSRMKPNSFVFAGANPDPEFDMYTIDQYKNGPLSIIAFFGSGAFGHPGTTLNNSSAFPGVYRALTDAIIENKLKPSREINIPKLALASGRSLASEVTQEDLNNNSIVPRTFTEENGYNFKVTQAVAINAWQIVTDETRQQAIKKYKNLAEELQKDQDDTIAAFKNIPEKEKEFVRGLIELLGEEKYPIVQRLKKAVNLGSVEVSF